MTKPKNKKKKTNYKKEDFTKKYQNLHYEFSMDRDKYRQFYNDGNIIEAFSILFVTIERALEHLWANFLINFQQLGKSQSSYSYKFKEEWDSSHLIRILHELGIITEKEFQMIRGFKKGRNTAVHILPGHYNSQIKSKILNHQFEQGLILLDSLIEKTFKTQPEIDKKILKTMRDDIVNYVKAVKIKERSKHSKRKKH